MSRYFSSLVLAVALSLLLHGLALLWPLRLDAISLEGQSRPSLAVQLRPAARASPAAVVAAAAVAPPRPVPAEVVRQRARLPAVAAPAKPVTEAPPSLPAAAASPDAAAMAPVAAASGPAPAPESSPPPAAPSGPVRLVGDLAVVCSSRPAPAYPALSRRLGETGKLVVRVLLDPEGRVAEATIAQSSDYTRLDEAALAAVRQWRCQPARRAGQPVAATALQPFSFVLNGG